MAASTGVESQLRCDARKLRKKLRQIEGLEVLGRPLTHEEKEKVERKVSIRAQLQDALARLSDECAAAATLASALAATAAAVATAASPAVDPAAAVDRPSAAQGSPTTPLEQPRPPSLDPACVDDEGGGGGPRPKKRSLVGSKSARRTLQEEAAPSFVAAGDRTVQTAAGQRLPKPAAAAQLKSTVDTGCPTKPSSSDDAAAARAHWLSASCSVAQLSGHADLVCALSIRGRFLASGSRDTTVKLWDLDSFTEVASFGGHTGVVTCLLLLDGPDAATVLGDKLRDAQHTGPARAIVSGSSDCSVKVWCCNTGTAVHSVYVYNPVTCLAYVGGRDVIAVGMAGGKLELLLSAGLQSLCSITCTDQEDIVCLSVDGCRLCTGAANGAVHVYDLAANSSSVEQVDCSSGSSHGSVSGSGDGSGGSSSAGADRGQEDGGRQRAALLRRLSAAATGCRGIRSLLLTGDVVLVGSGSHALLVLFWKTENCHRLPNHPSEYGVTDGLAVCVRDTCLLATAYDYDSGMGCINVRCLTTGYPYVGSLECVSLSRLLCLAAADDREANTVTLATGGYELRVWQIRLPADAADVRGRRPPLGCESATQLPAGLQRTTFVYKRELAAERAADSGAESSADDGDSDSEASAESASEESRPRGSRGRAADGRTPVSSWRCAVI